MPCLSSFDAYSELQRSAALEAATWMHAFHCWTKNPAAKASGDRCSSRGEAGSGHTCLPTKPAPALRRDSQDPAGRGRMIARAIDDRRLRAPIAITPVSSGNDHYRQRAPSRACPEVPVSTQAAKTSPHLDGVSSACDRECLRDWSLGGGGALLVPMRRSASARLRPGPKDRAEPRSHSQSMRSTSSRSGSDDSVFTMRVVALLHRSSTAAVYTPTVPQRT